MLGFRRRRRLSECATSEDVAWGPEATVKAQDFACDRAFETFFAEHYPLLVRTLRRLLGDAGQAEEVAADAFYRLHRRSPTLTAIDNPRAWVYRAGMNLALDM